MNSISFTVEEENLICMYHHDDRRRTMTAISDALPDIHPVDDIVKQIDHLSHERRDPHREHQRAKRFSP